ncbi:MAG TPA: RNA-binding protein [Bdellovibrionales bacterium]|nr:RNA-binding protein [Bdellovibrionales bacterium]
MGRKLFIGNLPFSVDSETLGSAFAVAGNVESAKVITDRDTGRSKGFGFVEMGSDDEAQNAITQMNGKDLMGRNISVAEARPPAPREDRGSFRRERY